MNMRTRQRDELVLDLYYNQNKTYREIAKEARICPRDIKRILDKDVQGVQGELPMSVSSMAYKLFSEGNSPLECAKTLNLREPEVTQLYRVLESNSTL
jgi:predicted transcriptional regulator